MSHFQNWQVIYPARYTLPGMTSFVDFNRRHYKFDKQVAGAINFMILLGIIVFNLSTNIGDWINDNNPYITRQESPYHILDRKKEAIPFKEMDTFFYVVWEQRGKGRLFEVLLEDV